MSAGKDQGKAQGWYLVPEDSKWYGGRCRFQGSLSFRHSVGISAVGGDFLLSARLSASRPFSCDICSSSQELGHKLPSSAVSVQRSPEAMRKKNEGGRMLCIQSLSDVFRA